MNEADLIGKSSLDVIQNLFYYRWSFDSNGKIVYPRIKGLTFVYYDIEKPMRVEDSYIHLNVVDGTLLNCLEFIEKEKSRGIGLTSRVQLWEPYSEEERKFAHIPMVDLDLVGTFDFIDSDEELLALIKDQIKRKTRLENGVILESSQRNYYFMGTDKLFCDEDFVSFLGACLTMKYEDLDGRDINLADSRQIGHALTPMAYMEEFNIYDFVERFSTLRVNSRNDGEGLPRVVDILE